MQKSLVYIFPQNIEVLIPQFTEFMVVSVAMYYFTFCLRRVKRRYTADSLKLFATTSVLYTSITVNFLNDPPEVFQC